MADRQTGGSAGDDRGADVSTADLASFVASLSYEDVPEEGVRAIERAVLDTVGVTLAGSTADAATRVASAVADGRGDATVLGRGRSLPLHDAVLVNGTAGHALDFDDVALAATDGHPSVPMVAPLVAVGEREGATGRELVAAYAAGFEAQGYVSRPISPGHYERGWHATATVGTVGAAAAVANLLGLPATEVEAALAVAASRAAGLKRNFGSMTKPVQVGGAARSGTSAALVAAEGVTADPGALDGDRGFLQLYGDGASDPGRAPALGRRWALVEDGIDLKKYPCCYYAHAAIHGAIRLAEAEGIDPVDVEEVAVAASQGAADALAHEDPSSGLEAKFSMEYLIAHGLVHGGVGLAAFAPDRLEDPDVERLRERVTLTADPELPYDSNAARVEVRTRSGETFERVQERPPGTHEEPLSRAELHGKFRTCADRAATDVDVEAALDALDALRDLGDVAGLLDHL